MYAEWSFDTEDIRYSGSISKCLGLSSSSDYWFQLPGNVDPGSLVSSAWALVFQVRELDGVPGFWLWVNSGLAVADI